jgi:hypothetical protein
MKLFLALFPVLGHAAISLIAANDASISWTGRKLAVGTSYAVDWEGASASVTISGATFVGLQVTDKSTGGSRWSLYFNNTHNPSYSDQSPGLKVATFITSPNQNVYTLAYGGSITGQTATYTVRTN